MRRKYIKKKSFSKKKNKLEMDTCQHQKLTQLPREQLQMRNRLSPSSSSSSSSLPTETKFSENQTETSSNNSRSAFFLTISITLDLRLSPLSIITSFFFLTFDFDIFVVFSVLYSL